MAIGGARGAGRDGGAAEKPAATAPCDEDLLHAVYAEHGRALLTYATRLLGDSSAAEDVVQETLIRMWRHPEVLTNGLGSIRGWLLTVVRNLVTDRIRARGARPHEVAVDPDAQPVQLDHSDRVVASIMVRHAMGRLSVDHRGVLHELYFQGRSLGEVATALGIPPGTVKSRSYYATRPAGPADRDGPVRRAGRDDGAGLNARPRTAQPRHSEWACWWNTRWAQRVAPGHRS